MTIYEVKRIHLEAFPYSQFFSRSTMRVFGQRLRDFSVRHVGNGTYHVSCPMRDYSGRVTGMTERTFFPDTGELKGQWEE